MPPIKTKFTTKPFTPIKGGQQCIRPPFDQCIHSRLIFEII